MVMKETQAILYCHDYIDGAELCEPEPCAYVCTWKRKGKGTCARPPTKTCNCVYNIGGVSCDTS